MNANKLVEAFVTVNSTPQMQVEAFMRNINNTEKFTIDLSQTVFRLPEKERTFQEMEKELTQIFMKTIGLRGLLIAVFQGLFDKSGPIEGIQKAVVTRACVKMGYRNPLAVPNSQ